MTSTAMGFLVTVWAIVFVTIGVSLSAIIKAESAKK